MAMVCGNNFGRQEARNRAGSKRGFGIVEVLIAAAVLGFLYMAVLNLQGSNREALLRIRGRDGATEVAQNLIDSLSALGVASLTDKNLPKTAEGNTNYVIPIDTITRSWLGQPGAVTNTMTVKYWAEVTVSPDANYIAKTSSKLLGTDSVEHVYAKRLDVKVFWKFKNSTQSITVSGVIR
jgi:type II secretory pathway pseudopilin PulG